MLARIYEFLDERIEQLKDNCKENEDQNSCGAGYDFGALGEAQYIKDQIIEIEQEVKDEN